jgi:hypothetical protein
LKGVLAFTFSSGGGNKEVIDWCLMAPKTFAGVIRLEVHSQPERFALLPMLY